MSQEFIDALNLATFPQPNGICAACLNDDKAAQGDLRTLVIHVFCQHNSCGGTYLIGARRWVLHTPIDRDTWIESLVGAIADVENLHSPPH